MFQLSLDFPFGLYEKNWSIFGPVYEKVMKRIPALEKAGIRSTIVGPESFTPDGQAILGKLTYRILIHFLLFNDFLLVLRISLPFL